MSFRLATSILTHPARDYLPALVERLDRRYHLQIANDTENKGQWANLRNAWLSLPQEADACMIIEDDVWPCLDFLPTVAHALDTLYGLKGPVPACFYCTWKEPMDKAQARGHLWMRINGGMWGQITILPPHMIRPFIRWVDGHWLYSSKHDGDGRLTMFLLAQQIPVYVSSVSLVEHIGYADSLLGHGAMTGGNPRTAYNYVGDHYTAIDRDWHAGLSQEDTIVTAGLSLKTYVRKNKRNVRPDYYEAIVNDGPYIPGSGVW
jgi:hypothetical protein